MKNFYCTLLFLGFSLFVSAQGISVEGFIPIKRISTITETTTSSSKTSKTSVTAKTADVTTTPSPTGSSNEVGITEGQLSVSLTGGATYSIPIAVPPGINGVVPQVGLTYNSQGSNDIAGYGWNISGVSAITRIPRTKFHDDVVGGFNLDANDRFALDGQRLILKSGIPYGAAGAIYETENFSNLKITSQGMSSSDPNPSFKVEYPDGSLAIYGATTDSRSITTWGITYWQNPQGVRISYNYVLANLANNNLTIEFIKYGSTGANTAINQIQFVYAPRKRPEQSYIAGQSILMNTILKEIKTTGNGVGFRNYILEPEETTLGYERLQRITEKSGDNTKSYNPTVFSYGGTTNSGVFDINPNTPQLSLTNINAENAETVVADFDGDGKNDFILFAKRGPDAYNKYWIYSDVYGSGFNIGYQDPIGEFSDVFATSFLKGDTTNGYKLSPRQGWTVAKSNDTNYTFDTYALIPAPPSSGWNNYPTLQYTKTVSFPTQEVSNGCYNYVTKIFPKKILSGDFNGDGLTDIIAVDTPLYSDECDYYNGNYSSRIDSQSVYFVDLKKDIINSATPIGNINEIIDTTTKVEVIDFNNDGKSDFMILTSGMVTVYTLGVTNNLIVLTTYTDIGLKTDKPCLLGDYNGDGKTDFVIPQAVGQDDWCFYQATGSSSSTISGFIKTQKAIGTVYEISKTSMEVLDYNHDKVILNEFSYIANDFNGDGKFDILKQKNKSIYCVYYYNPPYSPSVPLENRHPTSISFDRKGEAISTSFSLGQNINSLVFSFTNKEISGLIRSYPIPLTTNHSQPNLKLEFSLLTNNTIYTFNCTKDNRLDTRLEAITTGSGVKESISYKPLIDDYDYDYNLSVYAPVLDTSIYPNTDIATAPGFQVVSMLEKQSASVYKKQLFSYAGASSNMEGLGFLGFRASMSTNWFEGDSKIISSISKFDPNLRGANVATYTYLGLVAPEVAVNAAAPNIPRTSTITINNIRTVTETVVATNSIRFLPGATISPPAGNTFVAKITPDYDANGFAETNTVPPSNLISKSLSFFEASLSAGKVYKLQNTQSNTYNILENTGSETITIYDSYNNPTESISKIRKGGVGDQTTISTVAYQSPTTSPYAMGRPISKTQAVFSSGDSMTSKETYAYGSGTESNLLKKIEKWGNNTSAITEDNEYDAFGNITKKTITAGPNPRITYYEYKTAAPYYGRFLTESTDIEGLKTAFDYNSNGTLNFENKQTELNSWSNALKTSYEYDSWFKKTKTTDYLGKTNSYAYSRSGNVNSLITTTGDDGSYSEELFDDLGRKITSGVRDISGNTSKVSYEYDIYDRNIKVSEPYFGTGATQWNETKYDEYGRTDQNISFTGKTVSVSYSGLSTTVNDGSKTKTSVKNALGNVVTMTDTPGGTINYTYFANGNLKSTNYDGVVTSIEQDGWGRKTKLTDPSAGTYTYAYNGFGETTSETTPNGTTTYTLNAVGKLTAKTISGTNTNSSTIYNYNGTTKLLDSSIFTNTLEAGAVTTNTYSYDSYKRLVNTTEATPYATFTKTINLFDAFGRVETETTSGTANGKTSSKTIKNTYKNSYAWQILDNVSQQVLWQTNTVNARGQLLTADLGNGTAITNDFDQYGFAKEFKHDKTGSNPTNVMTLNTVFDAQKGNLTSRTNSMFNWNESFTYDSLDRLKTYNDAQGVLLTQNYDDRGRITQNNLGTYNYTNNAKVYQNTSVTVTADAKAYYLTKPLQTITYNTFKSPVEIIEDGIDKISFTYNDNNDRSTMFYGSLDVDKNLRPNRKYYAADGSMEIKQNILTGVTEFVTYIGGDGYSAPIVLKSDGTTQNYLYLHRDYQGTILAITDANAVVLEKRLFDAWGAILKVQNGAGVDLNGLTILDRGYTGHEHLQSVGLINMNGRLYDPKLHRFLQPDNYVQDPSNTQNFNRYGYCWNNPLKFTDPSGEWIWIVVGALIGGTINWIAHGATLDARGLAAFGIGAAAGALAGIVGPAAFTSAGGGAAGLGGFFAGAAGGAAGAAASQSVLSVGNHVAFGDPLMSGKEFIMGVAFGAALGGTINGVSALRNGNTFWKGTTPPIKVQPISIHTKGLVKTGGTPEIKTDAKLPSTTQTSTAPTTQGNTATVINRETGVVDVSKNPAFRYMGEDELQAIKDTGMLRGGREGETFFTKDLYKSAASAQNRLSLLDTPSFRVEFEIINKPSLLLNGTKILPHYNMMGKGSEFMTLDKVMVKLINWQPLK